MAQRVRNGERPRLVARVEVPDDAHGVAAALNAVRPSRTRLERRLVPATERNTALGDRRVHERLAFPQRNVAIAEVEVTRERHFEPLAHAERSVLLDVDCDVGRDQREAVSRSGGREGEGCAGSQSKTADEETQRQRPRSGRLQGSSCERKLRASGFPFLHSQKSTTGTSRCASSSTSKNSRFVKPNGPARTAPGKVWIALWYVSTVSL